MEDKIEHEPDKGIAKYGVNNEVIDKEEYPPRSLIIGNYTYTYKDVNKSGFSYRCKYKSICNFTITIDKDNINSY